jgi:ATP synthase mitochondrial F1 complex assembly factor 1
MAFLVNSHLRRLVGPAIQTLRASNQRRWAQVHDVRFLATAEQPRAILEKYRAKLERKAKDEGLDGLDDLKAAYASKIADLRKRDAVNVPTKPKKSPTPTQPSPSSADGPSTPPDAQSGTPRQFKPSNALGASPPRSSGATAVKPLSDILDLDKARALPSRELTAVWRLRHAEAPLSLCAVIPAATYRAMEAAARAAPQFVLPVPHPEQGAEMHFLQWAFDAASGSGTVLFTRLAEYKAHGEFAQPHTTVTHYTDLAEERGLVLMQGQLVEGRGARTGDAQFLVMCLQKFYGAWDGVAEDGAVATGVGERRQLLEWFSKGDSRFTIEKLMEETERLA